MSKGCNNCKHYRMGEFNIGRPDTPRTCTLGKDTLMHAWWEENGHKKDTDQLTEMPCFKGTELTILLGDMSNLIDKLKNHI